MGGLAGRYSSARKLPGVAALVLVFALAAIVYSQYGLDYGLSRDNAVTLYSGQRMAEGVPPYVSIFDNRGPLAPMLAGLGVTLANYLNTEDIYTVRVVFFLLGCSTVVSVYLLGSNLLQSRRVGAFAAFTFLGFQSFAQYAASGPEPKVPMVLFQVLSLLLTGRKRWFWAGVCGSLSFLVWQPMAIFPLVTLFLAAVQPAGSKLSAVFRTVAGAGLPTLAIGAYFYARGALYELISGGILFHVRYLDPANQEQSSFVSHLTRPAREILEGYPTMLTPIVVGLAMVVCFYFLRRSVQGSFRGVVARDAFAPILLSFPFPVVWSLLDFQGYDDFYVFLPYVAVGFAVFLDLAVARVEDAYGTALRGRGGQVLVAGLCLALVAAAGIGSAAEIDTPQQPAVQESNGLLIQKRTALKIRERFGEDAKLVSIGSPQLLALLHRTNPNPYAFIIRGIDRQIDSQTRGGFEGWLEELQEYDPDVIAFGKTKGVHKQELVSWLNARYRRVKVGPWDLYVKPRLLPERSSILSEENGHAGVSGSRPTIGKVAAGTPLEHAEAGENDA
ncbi:MAG: DolP-mannose mannosyltransferase [Actinomycetota bacterium]|nr:DolP-mannose mannosyltransferase [Actinomycetota bacterium]